MSDEFRWQEYAHITTWLASQPTPQYPAWATRLLFAFYVAPIPDCIDYLAETIRESMVESTLFSSKESEYVANYTREVARNDLKWNYDQSIGWHAESERNYSMRNRRNDEAFFDLLRRFFSIFSATHK